MMSVLGLPGRPPREQLSLCGAVITGEPGAATKAYRHDYNLLLPQIVSPVALPWSASSNPADLTPFYTTTTYLAVVTVISHTAMVASQCSGEHCRHIRLEVSRSEMFSVVVGAPYKANVSDNLGSDVVPSVSLVSARCLSVQSKPRNTFQYFTATQSSARPPGKLNLDAQCGSNSLSNSFQIRGFIRNIIALTSPALLKSFSSLLLS